MRVRRFHPCQKNPNGQTDQFITCHEIIKDGDRLYLAYRDAGIIILDISDPTKPTEVGNLDYVPPYNGDPGEERSCSTSATARAFRSAAARGDTPRPPCHTLASRYPVS